jgi:glycosyltransferase involved in cell wall biosynthesis
VKVLSILTRLNIGGPARQELALTGEFARLGVEHVVVAGTSGPNEGDLGIEMGADHVVRVPQLARPVRPWRDYPAYRRLKAVIAEQRPDVVHTHMSKAGFLGRSAAFAQRVPVTAHTYSGHVLDDYFSPAISKTIEQIERRLAVSTSLIFAVAETVRDEIVSHGIAPAERVTLVHHGVDLEPYLDIGAGPGTLRAQLRLPDDAILVGFAGRLAKVKRMDRLVEVARRVCSANARVHFVVAGDGPERAVVEEAIATPELEERMHMVGWVVDLADFYESIDLVVLTSSNEGMPISLIEAAAAGRPAVATRVGGVPEVIDDGVTGFVIDDAEAAADAVLRLVNDPVMRRDMGTKARARVVEAFGVRRLARDLERHYQSALDATRR